MNSTDWKSVLGAVAPTIATLLGGPLAGTAVSALSQTLLGKPDGTAGEVAPLIAQASPEVLAKIKQIDAELASKLAEAGIRVEEIAAADRAGARDREVKTGDWTPRVIAALVVGSWIAAEYFIFARVVEPTMRDFAMRLLGTLDGALMIVLGYYFGTSASSAQKNELIGKALDKG